MSFGNDLIDMLLLLYAEFTMFHKTILQKTTTKPFPVCFVYVTVFYSRV